MSIHSLFDTVYAPERQGKSLSLSVQHLLDEKIEMAKAQQKVSSNNRAISKLRRREQLIKSTIRCIANRGIAGTTMADVTQDAGLSLGIVNLHFQSKDKLFEETLQYLSDEYEAYWDAALEKSGDSAAEKMAAVVESDFSARVCERKKIAVWFAFWGEVKSRPTYLQICAKNDKRNNDVVADIARQLKKEANYKDLQPRAFAVGLAALVNGLWLDLLMTPKEITRKQARDICFSYLASSFPEHFKK